MKQKKTLLLSIITLLIVTSLYLIRDNIFGNHIPKPPPDLPLDLNSETHKKTLSNKPSKPNIKPFNTLKTRVLGESKYFVEKFLGKPNKVLSSKMYSNWSVLIYYKKVFDEFDNNKIKHIAIWIERDNRLNSKVTKVICVNPNSYLRVGTSKIKLP
ncbi:hypothetical protein MHM83_07770 [Tenacibaculum sp. Mcav3-52]|uniref:hypothetical protein n=1 Tax=Tenacibaculum sp. Mcav3-52 TaxID=2917762 RepID=UPI001EF31DD4|nr:hypothetical protein [Tenacibaculum sp. Mcav3-52]MCG7501766.1 hypothetical protein [Tenacibaculum sp. Mcav3-52]